MTFHPAIIDEAMTAVCQSERFDSSPEKDSATYGITGEYLFYRCSKQRI